MQVPCQSLGAFNAGRSAAHNLLIRRMLCLKSWSGCKIAGVGPRTVPDNPTVTANYHQQTMWLLGLVFFSQLGDINTFSFAARRW